MKYNTMTEREKQLLAKKAEIEAITRKQRKLMLITARMMTRPYKRPATLFRRLAKVVSNTLAIRILESQKQIAISRPVIKDSPQPSFKQGCSPVIRGMAIVGENGTEVIFRQDGGELTRRVLAGSEHETLMGIQRRMNCLLNHPNTGYEKQDSKE